LLAIASPSFAQDGHSHDYNFSIFSGSEMAPVKNKGARSETIQTAKASFPGWMLSVDKFSGSFTDLYGKAMPVSGGTREEKANQLFSKLQQLGIEKNEWQKVGDRAASHAQYVHYVRKINGREVVFSNLSFKFTPGGELIRIRANAYGQPAQNAQVTLGKADVIAANTVLQDVQGAQVTATGADDEWVWFPVPAANGYELHPAWRVTAQGNGKDGLPFDLYAYVDATNGDLLYRDNNVKADVDIQVVGSVYKTNTSNPATNEPLPDMDVIVGSSTLQLNDNGEISLPGSSATVTFRLSGAWSTVRDASNGNMTPEFTTSFSQPSNLYVFPQTAPSSSQKVNAYYHVNTVHNYMKSVFPTFTTLDFSLPTNVDITTTTCNAFYNGSSINFYAAGGGCNSFAEIGDIVYHEYGHGINDMYYDDIRGSGMRNGALNEGYADVWGMCITKDSILGRNARGAGTSIRRYDGVNSKMYPQDIVVEVHGDGEIIAGAWYDVAKNIGSYETMGQIFSRTFDDVVDGPNGMEGPVFHEALISALQADDNDANLSNGTPHFEQIVRAFAKHGIYLHYDAELVHTEVAHPAANTDITVTAQLNLTNPTFFNSLSLIYRTRGVGTWNTIAMTNNGGTFTAQIPAQPMSTLVDYYFQVQDAFNIDGNTYPEGFSTDPARATFVTIPYQFAVGVHPRVQVDFETDVPLDWSVADVAGDDATSGKWVRGIPFRSSYSTNPFGQYISQTGNDHTTGSGNCLITGNTTSTNTYNNRSSSDVDGGQTTVMTGAYDLSNYVFPIIEYYRWYSNDRGGGQVDRKDDRWRVEIKNETMTGWTAVENTNQTDVNWRRRVFSVYQYLSHAKGVQMRFRAIDDNDDSNVEAGIDDFFIYDGVPASVNNVAGVKAEIYPNPADNNIHITMSAAVKGTISINDVTGKQIAVMNMDGTTNSHVFNTTPIVPGQYFLTIRTEAKTIQSHKIVIAH